MADTQNGINQTLPLEEIVVPKDPIKATDIFMELFKSKQYVCIVSGEEKYIGKVAELVPMEETIRGLIIEDDPCREFGIGFIYHQQSSTNLFMTRGNRLDDGKDDVVRINWTISGELQPAKLYKINSFIST